MKSKIKTSVAILGGSFDPPHIGHTAILDLLLDYFDRVYMMPCFKHRYGKQMAPAEDRLAMCEIVSKRNSRISVFKYEIQNQLEGETYYLIKKLMSEKFLNDKYDFHFVIGGDNAVTFDRWFKYKELKKIAKFVVIPRTSFDFKYKNAWYLKYPHSLIVPGTPIPNVSSTNIRNALKIAQEPRPDLTKKELIGDVIVSDMANAYVKQYLNVDVFNYIKKHNLYKGDSCETNEA